jgi:heptaprenyl diphosphate synthase
MYELAAAIEMIHVASLVHDDVIDEAARRRGNPTLNVRF